MPPDGTLVNRVRTAIGKSRPIEEKKMFAGLAIMVDGKMCVTVSKGRRNCRSIGQFIGLGSAAGEQCLVKSTGALGLLLISCSIRDATASNPLTKEKHSPSRMKARGLSATSISRSTGSGCGQELCIIRLSEFATPLDP